MRPRLASPPTRIRPPPKTAEPFYKTARWRGFAATMKKERGRRCEVCGSRDRIIVDHIVERRDGGADYDPSNIQLLCGGCHNTKTAAERARRASVSK